MNISELRQLLTSPHERVVVVEEGEPALVVMGLEAYKTLKGQGETKGQWPTRASGETAAEIKRETLRTAEARDESVNAALEAERLRARELAAKLAMESAVESFKKPEDVYSRIRLEDLPL